MKKSDIIEQLSNLPDDANIIQVLPNEQDNPRTLYFPHPIDDALHELDNDGITDAEFRHLIVKYMLAEDNADNMDDQQRRNREAVIAILDIHSQIFHLNYENWKLRKKLDSEIVLKGEDASKFREMLFNLEAINERDAFIAKALSDEDREKMSEHTEVDDLKIQNPFFKC